MKRRKYTPPTADVVVLSSRYMLLAGSVLTTNVLQNTEVNEAWAPEGDLGLWFEPINTLP